MSSNDNIKKDTQRLKTKTVMLSSDVTNELRAQLEEQRKALFGGEKEDTQSEKTITNKASALPASFFYSTDEEEHISKESDNDGYDVFGGGDPLSENLANEADQKNNTLKNEDENEIDRKRKETRQIASNIVKELINSKPKENESLNKELQEVKKPIYVPTSENSPVDKQYSNHTSLDLKKDLTMNEGISWIEESMLCGFLVSFDKNPNGDFYELRSGKLIVTNIPTKGLNTLVILDESVSSMHAMLKISESELTVFDQFSKNGTKIRHAKDNLIKNLSGECEKIFDKDIITFGTVSFKVYLI